MLALIQMRNKPPQHHKGHVYTTDHAAQPFAFEQQVGFDRLLYKHSSVITPYTFFLHLQVTSSKLGDSDHEGAMNGLHSILHVSPAGWRASPVQPEYLGPPNLMSKASWALPTSSGYMQRAESDAFVAMGASLTAWDSMLANEK